MACIGARSNFAVFFLAAALAALSPTGARAGSGNFDGGNDHDKDMIHFFGYTRGENGKPVPSVNVTISTATGDVAEISDVNGLFFFDTRGRAFDPAAVNVSCAKDGYKDAIAKKERYSGENAPLMVICLMQRK